MISTETSDNKIEAMSGPQPSGTAKMQPSSTLEPKSIETDVPTWDESALVLGDQPAEGDQPVAPTQRSAFNVQPSTDLQPSDEPLVFGNYEVEAELGRGGMGIVYRARHRLIGDRLAALKVIHPHLLTDESVINRFRREAYVAAGVKHPNVVAFYAFGEEEGQYYLAMEYVQGKTLDERLAEEEFAFNRSLPILEQLALGIDAMHRRGFVHRDIKPENVVVDDDDHAVIIDLGIARTVLGGTRSELIGTPAYVAPEVLKGERPGPTLDRYALGVVAYEMLVGRRPFSAPTPEQLLYEIALVDPVDPRMVRPEIPSSVSSALCRQLSKDPRERFPTAQAFISDLQLGFYQHSQQQERDKGRSFAARWASRATTRLQHGVRAGLAIGGIMLLPFAATPAFSIVRPEVPAPLPVTRPASAVVPPVDDAAFSDPLLANVIVAPQSGSTLARLDETALAAPLCALPAASLIDQLTRHLVVRHFGGEPAALPLVENPTTAAWFSTAAPTLLRAPRQAIVSPAIEAALLQAFAGQITALDGQILQLRRAINDTVPLSELRASYKTAMGHLQLVPSHPEAIGLVADAKFVGVILLLLAVILTFRDQGRYAAR